MRVVPLLAVLALLLTAPGASGQILSRRGDQVALSEAVQDMVFLSGREVRITGSSTRDIFAAGAHIDIDGAAANHLIVAGREILAAPAHAQGLIAAGSRLELRRGAVVDDLVAAGGELTLDPAARINGSAVIAGGVLRIASPIGGALRGSGNDIRLDGPVGGEARLSGRRIVVGPAARVGGDLYLRGDVVEVAPGAVIGGRLVREAPRPRRGQHAWMAIGLLFVVGALLLSAIIATVAPGLVQGATARLRERTAPTLGLGALAFLLGPLVVAVLAVTILGAPLAMFVMAVYLAVLAPAFASVAYLIGQSLARGRAAARPGAVARFGWTLLGALVLAVLCAIPLAGGLVWLAAAIAGMGAVLAQAAGLLRAPPAA